MENQVFNYIGFGWAKADWWASLNNMTNNQIFSEMIQNGFGAAGDEDEEVYTKTEKATLNYEWGEDSICIPNMNMVATLKIDKKSGEITQTTEIDKKDGWCAGVLMTEVGFDQVLIYSANGEMLVEDMIYWGGALAEYVSETLLCAIEEENPEEFILESGFRYMGDFENGVKLAENCGSTSQDRRYELRILNIGTGEPINMDVPEFMFRSNCDDGMDDVCYEQDDCMEEMTPKWVKEAINPDNIKNTINTIVDFHDTFAEMVSNWKAKN